MVTMGKEEGEMTWENSIKTYTWPYVKKIGSGNLLYDTGNPKPGPCDSLLLLLLLSRFSHIRLCATPETAAHQASPSLGFSRQEHWSGLPFPSLMHESEKWSRSVVPNTSRPHGLQPTRLLRRWDFLGKSTGVGCHWGMEWGGRWEAGWEGRGICIPMTNSCWCIVVHHNIVKQLSSNWK